MHKNIVVIEDDILADNGLTMEEFQVLYALTINRDNLQKPVSALERKGFLIKKSDATTIGFGAAPKGCLLVEKVLVASRDLVNKQKYTHADYVQAARMMIDAYPTGIKPGTSVPWRAAPSEIAQRLRIFMTNTEMAYDLNQIINATKRYVELFKSDKSYMMVLKHFITKPDDKLGIKILTSELETVLTNEDLSQINWAGEVR